MDQSRIALKIKRIIFKNKKMMMTNKKEEKMNLRINTKEETKMSKKRIKRTQ